MKIKLQLASFSNYVKVLEGGGGSGIHERLSSRYRKNRDEGGGRAGQKSQKIRVGHNFRKVRKLKHWTIRKSGGGDPEQEAN